MTFDDFRRLNFREAGSWPLLPKILILARADASAHRAAPERGSTGRTSSRRCGTAQAEEVKLARAIRAEEGQGDQFRALRAAAEGGRAVVRRAGQAAPQPRRDRRAADRHQPGRPRPRTAVRAVPSGARRKGWRTSTPSCRSASAITGNYHDMGAFASDVAQLPRIVTLNDVAIANNGGTLSLDARREDVPLPRRRRDRQATRAQATRRRRRRNETRVLRSRWSSRPRLLAGMRRREPSGSARVDGGAGQGTRRASSIRCRRSSRTSRSRTTRTTCRIRSSRARSSRRRAAAQLAPDLARRQRAARSVSARSR